MYKFAAVAVIPLFAGFLCAQEQTTTQTTTTTTTWNGTLVDAGCHSTKTERHESSSSNPDEHTTQTTTTKTTTISTECPVTTTTTTFGLVTADGRYYTFDNPSNTRIVEVVKGNKKWLKYMTDRQPVKVRVVGTPNGDVVVMQSIR